MKSLTSRAFWLVPVLVLAMAMQPSEGLRFLIGETIMNFGLAIIIDRFTRLPRTLSTRVLGWGPIVAVGLASYSLFMWQQLFLNRESTTALTHFPRNLALVVGGLSYNLIEKPIARFRRHCERRWFSDERRRPHLAEGDRSRLTPYDLSRDRRVW